MGARVSRRAAAVAAVAAAVAAVAGCSAVPTSGPVKQGNEAAPADLQMYAAKPFGGEGVEDVVRGFMVAMADFGGDHSVARMYLTPDAAPKWQPRDGVVVIKSRGFDNGSGPQFANGVVRVTTTGLGALDSRGFFHPGADADITDSYRMVKVNDEWRIADPPDLLRLLPSEVERDYRDSMLYFPSPAGRPLVPVPVWLPADQPDMAGQLVQALLDGPPDELLGAALPLPHGVALAGPVVMSSGGMVTVSLTAPPYVVSTDTMRSMVASLVWTLRSVPEVQSVKVLVGGAPQLYPTSVTAAVWSQFDPDGVRGPGLYGTARKGGMVDVESGDAVRFPVGAPTVGLAGFVVAPPTVEQAARVPTSAQRTAVLSISGDSAVAAVSAGPGPRVLYTGTLAHVKAQRTADAFSQPSWDRYGYVWTAEQRGASRQVIAGLRGEVWDVVSAPDLAGSTVSELRISPDGSRVAVIATSAPGRITQLLLGSIVRDAHGHPTAITHLRSVTPSLMSVTDVAWASATSLAVVGVPTASSAPTAFLVRVDGWSVQELPALSGLRGITAAPGHDVAALTADGSVWAYAGGNWRPYGTGLRDIAYAG